jgi:hypothetical protein
MPMTLAARRYCNRCKKSLSRGLSRPWDNTVTVNHPDERLDIHRDPGDTKGDEAEFLSGDGLYGHPGAPCETA